MLQTTVGAEFYRADATLILCIHMEHNQEEDAKQDLICIIAPFESLYVKMAEKLIELFFPVSSSRRPRREQPPPILTYDFFCIRPAVITILLYTIAKIHLSAKW